MTPTVSILIPTYNAANTVTRTIASLQAQTMKDWEAVIADDGSTDDTLERVRQMAESDQRIKVLPPDEHLGTPYLVRRRAAEAASAPRLCAIDADDIIDPDFVERLLKRAEETGAQVVLPVMVTADTDGTPTARLAPTEEFDLSLLTAGRSLIRHTLYRWEIGLNGALVDRDLYLMPPLDGADTHNPYYDELEARRWLIAAERVAFADTRYYLVKNEASLTSAMTERRFANLELGKEIDRLIVREFGADSEEASLSAMHRFALWMDAKRNLRDAPRPFRRRMKPMISDAVATLPMDRLLPRLSLPYRLYVQFSRLLNRL